MIESTARRDLVRYSRAMHTAGWVANHDGNLSARLGSGRIICTPTAVSKADVGIEMLVVVDAAGRKISGAYRSFSEMVLHRAVYDRREQVHAVVHAHPPFATALGAAGQSLPHPFLPEAAISLGAWVPTVPLTAPGKPGAEALSGFVRRCDAVLIAGNGAMAWGPDLETAHLRLELVEHLCRIALTALPLGGVRRLPREMVRDLVEKRAKAGLAAPDEAPPSVDPAIPEPSAEPNLASRAAERALAGLPVGDRALAERLATEIASKLR